MINRIKNKSIYLIFFFSLTLTTSQTKPFPGNSQTGKDSKDLISSWIMCHAALSSQNRQQKENHGFGAQDFGVTSLKQTSLS